MRDTGQRETMGGEARLGALGGIAILFLAVCAFLLPLWSGPSGSAAVGGLLALAGLIEVAAARARREVPVRHGAMLAGGFTCLAGLLLLVGTATPFVPAVQVVAIWLFVRGALLAVTPGHATSGAAWIGRIAGAIDIALGLLLILGVRMSAIILVIFGPAPALVARFAVVFAASFAVTGVSLLLVSREQRARLRVQEQR